MMENFVCGQCGGKFPMDRVGLGMNIGTGPEYICDHCAPPATAEQGIEIIAAAVKATNHKK